MRARASPARILREPVLSQVPGCHRPLRHGHAAQRRPERKLRRHSHHWVNHIMHVLAQRRPEHKLRRHDSARCTAMATNSTLNKGRRANSGDRPRWLVSSSLSSLRSTKAEAQAFATLPDLGLDTCVEPLRAICRSCSAYVELCGRHLYIDHGLSERTLGSTLGK